MSLQTCCLMMLHFRFTPLPRAGLHRDFTLNFVVFQKKPLTHGSTSTQTTTLWGILWCGSANVGLKQEWLICAALKKIINWNEQEVELYQLLLPEKFQLFSVFCLLSQWAMTDTRLVTVRTCPRCRVKGIADPSITLPEQGEGFPALRPGPWWLFSGL